VRGIAGSEEPGQAMVVKFDKMTPANGPYASAANPVRGIPRGGLPWVLTAGTGSLSRDGHLFVQVRGLVLASQDAVPAGLQGTNPFPAFRAIVSCQTVGAGDTATIANISTGDFRADASGDVQIDARVILPQPCIAPIVFITGPSGVGTWLAVSGG
jgi:hypothetical protein